jgi:hypothetical protein
MSCTCDSNASSTHGGASYVSILLGLDLSTRKRLFNRRLAWLFGGAILYALKRWDGLTRYLK